MAKTPMHPNQAAAYLQHGDQEIAKLAFSYLELIGAIQGVYYSAVWLADRPVDEEALWTRVRDAAGFTPGLSPKATDLGFKMREVQKGNTSE